MRIHLEQLPHQEEAIKKILEAMQNCLDDSGSDADAGYTYANPILKKLRGIDIKMETGTGKTYVYTRLMHELYLHFGLNKFIVMVPSLAIKEGVKSFITSESATQHFRELYHNQKINLGIVNAGDFNTKKGKRKQFAAALANFCEASRRDIGGINTLLLNDAMLGSKSMTRNDYDQTLIGSSSCPAEALRLTRPIIIIDEPHRFSHDTKAWENIKTLNPQLIIRFGATFPSKELNNIVYNLNAVESFNQGLVKAVNVIYPDLPEHQAEVKYRVESVTNKELFLRKDKQTFTLQIGEDLSLVDPLFEGNTTYEGKKLSNDLEVFPGMTLIPGTWTNSYQELVIRQSIDAHFAKEKDLFYRPGGAPRVKTISLYFIDSIASYRDQDGWLKSTFEKLLSEKLTSLIQRESGEYRDYLLATLASLKSDQQQVHAGYFAEDNAKKGDDGIQAEVDDILRNKETMLQFKDDHGNWNTRRFLFSKWTLREGWDNPNVFVLTKLRTSGSENSKIQEVGRGLRLPVDEQGNRLSQEEFRLDFIVDYSERDFADKLIGEINSDGGGLQTGKITDSVLAELVKINYASDLDSAFDRLKLEGIIDRNQIVLKPDELAKLIPLGLKQGKIRSNYKQKSVVHLRRDNWEKVKSLWQETSKRFMLQYNRLTKDEVDILVGTIFDPKIFADSKGRVKQLSARFEKSTNSMILDEQVIVLPQDYGQLKYGDFLKRIHKKTYLPLNLIHAGVTKALGSHPDQKLFNDITLHNVEQAFLVEFYKIFSEKYEYDSLDFNANISLFTDTGDLVDKLDQSLVGTSEAIDVKVLPNYLYDEAVYDSEIEHEILKYIPPQEVLVFGKLPRRSIRIPTFIGGTTSPDFVYVIKNSETDTIKIHALIESKGKDIANLSAPENAALQAQNKISKHLKNVEIKPVYDSKEVEGIIRSLIAA